MKKFLSLFGSLTLVVSTASTIVSCGQTEQQPVDHNAVLKYLDAYQARDYTNEEIFKEQNDLNQSEEKFDSLMKTYNAQVLAFNLEGTLNVDLKSFQQEIDFLTSYLVKEFAFQTVMLYNGYWSIEYSPGDASTKGAYSIVRFDPWDSNQKSFEYFDENYVYNYIKNNFNKIETFVNEVSQQVSHLSRLEVSSDVKVGFANTYFMYLQLSFEYHHFYKD